MRDVRWHNIARTVREATGQIAVVVVAVVVCVTLLQAAEDAPSVENSPTGEIPVVEPPKSTDWSSFRNGLTLWGLTGSRLPAEPELLWKHPAADGVASTAAIVGDRAYVATLSGELHCFELRTGDIHWTYHSVEKGKETTFAPGFKSSPTVTDKLVLLGDEDGVFHAVDRRTGKSVWTFATDAEIISSATIIGERVLFGSYDNNLYCLELADGRLSWKFATEGYVNCTPAVADGFTFVTGCDEQLRVIDIATGEQVRQMPLNSYLIASPAVVGDLLYVGTYNSEVVAVDWKKLEILWTYRDPDREFPFHASAAITQDRVVVGGRDKQMHCLDRQSGKQVWAFPTSARVDSSPVVIGDRVCFGSSDRNLYLVDLKDGKELWKFNAGKPITASPAVGSGCLVIGTDSSNGWIYCFGQK